MTGETENLRTRPFGDVAAEIGHELNNQIGIVSGRAELARLYLDRGRIEDVRSGVDVILKQMDRMRILAERLRGLRAAPRSLRVQDVRATIEAALAEHPLPGLAAASSVLAESPSALADSESIRGLFSSLREHLLAHPGAVVALDFRREEGANSATLTLRFEAMPTDRVRTLLAEATRALAPTGLTTRVDFPESGAVLQIDFPIEAFATLR